MLVLVLSVIGQGQHKSWRTTHCRMSWVLYSPRPRIEEIAPHQRPCVQCSMWLPGLCGIPLIWTQFHRIFMLRAKLHRRSLPHHAFCLPTAAELTLLDFCFCVYIKDKVCGPYLNPYKSCETIREATSMITQSQRRDCIHMKHQPHRASVIKNVGSLFWTN